MRMGTLAGYNGGRDNCRSQNPLKTVVGLQTPPPIVAKPVLIPNTHCSQNLFSPCLHISVNRAQNRIWLQWVFGILLSLATMGGWHVLGSRIPIISCSQKLATLMRDTHCSQANREGGSKGNTVDGIN